MAEAPRQRADAAMAIDDVGEKGRFDASRSSDDCGDVRKGDPPNPAASTFFLLANQNKGTIVGIV